MTVERLPWISADPASLRLFELAQKVAAAPTTLLITGESGTGKDYLARVIHELGPRRDAPFLKIDCASLPRSLSRANSSATSAEPSPALSSASLAASSSAEPAHRPR